MTLSDHKIEIAMAKRQLTKTMLAKKAGISRGRLNILLNSKTVTPISVGKLAKALECDVLDIIETKE